MEGMPISNPISLTASYPSDESGCLDYNSFSPRHRPVRRTFQDNAAGQDLLPTLPETATGFSSLRNTGKIPPCYLPEKDRSPNYTAQTHNETESQNHNRNRSQSRDETESQTHNRNRSQYHKQTESQTHNRNRTQTHNETEKSLPEQVSVCPCVPWNIPDLTNKKRYGIEETQSQTETDTQTQTDTVKPLNHTDGSTRHRRISRAGRREARSRTAGPFVPLSRLGASAVRDQSASQSSDRHGWTRPPTAQTAGSDFRIFQADRDRSSNLHSNQ
ncbi:unnamed protein product [Nesidiocoris tenuis]|uniref:Uncharacterized protein n=1 Tax=Nesidiocoris tenuis TaxID=355587 RepID=A0A6H5FXB0_9HEMI|nr:unnamed protein product [Nesidiocoris tenuis]